MAPRWEGSIGTRTLGSNWHYFIRLNAPTRLFLSWMCLCKRHSCKHRHQKTGTRMFTVVVFVFFFFLVIRGKKRWKRCKCPAIRKQIGMLWFIHNGVLYSSGNEELQPHNLQMSYMLVAQLPNSLRPHEQ